MRYQMLIGGKGIVLGKNIVEAKSMVARLRGLMFKKSFDDFDGMIICHCRSIHTFFMHMSIHAIFVDKSFRIVRIYRNLRPWRITSVVFKAESVLEISASTNIVTVEEGDGIEAICLN